MPRHRSRQQATHSLSAEREGEISCSSDGGCPDDYTCGEDGVCVDAYGTPITGQTEIVSGEPVVFEGEGTTYVHSSTGERVSRAPRIIGRAGLMSLIEEGDLVALTPLAQDAPSSEITGLAITSIDPDYNAWARAGSVTIELESV